MPQSQGLLDQLKILEERYRAIINGYASMDIEKKIETVQKIDDLFKDILKILTI